MASLATSDAQRKEMYKGAGTRTKSGTQHRQNSAISIRKKKRQQHLTSKRLKSGPNSNSSTDINAQRLTEAAINATVNTLLTTLRSTGTAASLTAALKHIRTLLSDVEAHAPPIATVVKLNGVPVLIQYLTSNSAEQRLEATWCLSNIASGTHEEAQHVLPAVPYLIGFLTGPEPALQEQR
jgi:importin subunit alpha-1